MALFHPNIACGSKSWTSHVIVSTKYCLWKQVMNRSWHRFNPNTVVKAIHAPFMAPFQRQIAFESKP
ncbi:hypothetical protein ACFPTR_12860 [Aliibacillus thermotolerans]|uniref:Uncharacterized protein n=1 Tax=Aliibacillus thermotolerans TaxID=1834418 RepID=A0ABW0U9T4_9BACI|nr:hypothetical protein [Aliibacillus thermotolerans]MDA3130742.1 hypothetical protein [Aliibacillus thermotolerans]